MNQADLNRAVAHATGETISTVKRIGFLIADPDEPIEDPESPDWGGHVIDWDDLERFRIEANEEAADAFCSQLG